MYEYKQAAWHCSMDMQRGRTKWACSLDRRAACTCSVDTQHRHAARRHDTDKRQDMQYGHAPCIRVHQFKSWHVLLHFWMRKKHLRLFLENAFFVSGFHNFNFICEHFAAQVEISLQISMDSYPMCPFSRIIFSWSAQNFPDFAKF